MAAVRRRRDHPHHQTHWLPLPSPQISQPTPLPLVLMSLYDLRYNPQRFRLPGQGEKGTLSFRARRTAEKAATSKSGTSCPCCGQHVQVYRRRIYKRMAKVMYWIVWEFEKTSDWVELKDGPLFRGGDNAKLALWGLVQTKPRREVETHKRHSGLWMPTREGIAFAKGRMRVPQYVYVYNGTVVGFSEETVSISESLEGDFNFEELSL